MKQEKVDLFIKMAQVAIADQIPPQHRTKEAVQKKLSHYVKYAQSFLDDPEPMTIDQEQYFYEQVFNNVFLVLSEGITIIDRKSDFDFWLDKRRPKIEFDFWNRYKKYLSHKKGWSEAIIQTLDKDSDKILDLLGDPKHPKGWTRHGLMIGDVQAGKTANYTAIINKAADAGYQVIIVLAGITENLRKQTQDRLEKEFVGIPSNIVDSKGIKGKWKPIGVGEMVNFDSVKKWPISFTSTSFDFQSAAANQITQQLKDDDIYLFVLKKNKTVLTNLNDWLGKNNPKIGEKINLSALVIDDESDNASVNTNKNELNPTAINSEIRKILASFTRASYLAVTATPYANIFIDGENEDKTHAFDLFPKDYIHLLNASSEYIGAAALFGADATPKAKECIKVINLEDIESTIPLKHKKDQLQIRTINDLPESLLDAVRYFLLVQALMDCRPGMPLHRSMLINISRFTGVQISIRDVLNTWLENSVFPSVKNYHAVPEWASEETTGEFHLLKKVWDKYELGAVSQLQWKDFSSGVLGDAIPKVKVVSVNQKSEPLVYDNFPAGFRVIAVGGFSLSRGLTLEGLVVSYFYRNSRAYDTLMQMGRWFGYRSHYLDYFKLWMSADSIVWYQTIVEATENLRYQINRMNRIGKSPSDFGLAVQRQPLSRLLITARNKMRNTQAGKTLPIIISGHLVETPRLYNDIEVNRSNGALVKEFIADVATIGRRESDETTYYMGSALLWHDVPREMVADLVAKFKSHKWNLNFQSVGLSNYIRDDEDTLLWDVALITKQSGENCDKEIYEIPDGVIEVNKQLRSASINADDNQLKIGKKSVRVGPGGITQVGLTYTQIRQIEKRIGVSSDGSAKKKIKDSDLLAIERPPIVLIYSLALKIDSEHQQIGVFKPGTTVFAIGLGFPQLAEDAEEKYVQYVYNPVAARSFLGIDEDEMSEDEDDDE